MKNKRLGTIAITCMCAAIAVSGCGTTEPAGDSTAASVTTLIAPSEEPAGTDSTSETSGIGRQEEERSEALEAEPLTAEAVSSEEESSSSTEVREEDVEAMLASMTLEEKVAQLFFVTPEQLTGYEAVTMTGEGTAAAFNQVPVGGIIYMGGNLVDSEQTRSMVTAVQQISRDRIGLPVFTFLDEEGGTVIRISGKEGFPEVPYIGDMSAVGVQGDPQGAYTVGQTIGTYLKDFGFNGDFAPDTDTFSNPANTVVASRSFGSDPQLVTDMALQCGKGLEDAGIIAVYKHFPGHGATEGDTHAGYAYTDKTLEELKACDLIPFQAAIDNGARFIMVGHFSLPNVTGDNVPASLNPAIVTDLLRGDLGFTGIAITDAVEMGALVQNYTTAQICVEAVKAGEDMILMPPGLMEGYNAILGAISNGEITEERIDESVRRILRVKLSMLNY